MSVTSKQTEYTQQEMRCFHESRPGARGNKPIDTHAVTTGVEQVGDGTDWSGVIRELVGQSQHTELGH